MDLDITLKVRNVANRLGVEFMNKTTMCDLLTHDGRIAGACGYSILDGTFYAVTALADTT